ncbi:hypothetical protein QVD17_38004 [Tagetes erecta]|uniref:Uncharacterized protein n=1 Tax=Tagetes erecta TaxID=13708 RepID=A0AAD8JV20_TARER|nr:hypothetical protein QVD17_38004 [Tagetes erecta]
MQASTLTIRLTGVSAYQDCKQINLKSVSRSFHCNPLLQISRPVGLLLSADQQSADLNHIEHNNNNNYYTSYALILHRVAAVHKNINIHPQIINVYYFCS